MATKKAPGKSDVESLTVSGRALSLRGQEFVGEVLSDKMNKSVVVGWEWRRYVPKYERYEKRFSKVTAHNPPNIDAKKGDLVRIKETRPISKTKHFVVVEIIKRKEMI